MPTESLRLSAAEAPAAAAAAAAPAVGSLEAAALRVILANLFNPPNNGATPSPTQRKRRRNAVSSFARTQTYMYISPCLSSNDDQQQPLPLQEATSALLAARALAKTGGAGDITSDSATDNDYSTYAWDILDTILSSAGSNGIIPRYRYVPNWNNNATAYSRHDSDTNSIMEETTALEQRRYIKQSTSSSYYVPGTAYPSPDMFGDVPLYYNAADASDTDIITSGRISSPPFHATAALHSFYLSNQTDADLLGLSRTYDGLWRYHRLLHENVMRGCNFEDDSDDDENRINGEAESLPQQQKDSVPCYNIIHPWESNVDQSSPLWKEALHLITEEIDEQDWTPSFKIPKEVSDSFDYPTHDNVYNAMLYLIECQRNATAMFEAEENKTNTSSGGDDNTSKFFAFESYLLERCPFAVLDVGNAAALARADQDLLTMGQILRDEDIPRVSRPTSLELDAIAAWSGRSKKVLDSLWDNGRRAYLSRAVVFDRTGPNETYVASNETIALDVPVASNFMAAWGDLPDDFDKRATAISFQLLQREGRYAFNCDNYFIRSVGGCGKKEGEKSAAIIDPSINYWVSYGMVQSGMAGLGRYIRNSTLNLVCGLPNVDGANLSLCSDDVAFPIAYDAELGSALIRGGCSSTFTASAATVYNMVVLDKAFKYEAPPPLSSSWVIFLIALELAIALGIGISCVLLSVNMMRRLSSEDDGDAFARLLRSQRADASFLYGDSGDTAAAGDESFADTTSVATAVGLGDELGRLDESPIVKASSPLRNVQRYLFTSRARDDEEGE